MVLTYRLSRGKGSASNGASGCFFTIATFLQSFDTVAGKSEANSFRETAFIGIQFVSIYLGDEAFDRKIFKFEHAAIHD